MLQVHMSQVQEAMELGPDCELENSPRFYNVLAKEEPHFKKGSHKNRY